jgi:colanic acid/amylovoran biosynthesis glycosyltransferase
VRRRGRPLHVLDVGVRWPPETFVGWKLEGLAARGMRVTLASTAIHDADARLRGVELLNVAPRPGALRAALVAVRAGLPLLFTAPRRLVRLARGIRRHVPFEARRTPGGLARVLGMFLPLARLRPDVVVFEWHGAAVTYMPLFDVWDRPIATSCRGSDISVYPFVPGREEYARRLPEVLRRASAVHCVSESLKREASAFGLDPAKARVIRPAVDPELFRPSPNGARPDAAADVLRVINVGWLRWQKGYEYGLAAVRRLVDQGVPVRLDIVGGVVSEEHARRGERERILHTVADLGLEAHVRLLGHLPSSEVSRRLRASDVLLHPAVTEGLPNAIVEAMACGVPVVATRCGGIPEAVADGVQGFVVAPRDPEPLAGALLRLARDPGLRRRMGAAGRARVLSELTLEHEHSAFAAMYREIGGA